jgi:hypothetical protein
MYTNKDINKCNDHYHQDDFVKIECPVAYDKPSLTTSLENQVPPSLTVELSNITASLNIAVYNLTQLLVLSIPE